MALTAYLLSLSLPASHDMIEARIGCWTACVAVTPRSACLWSESLIGNSSRASTSQLCLKPPS